MTADELRGARTPIQLASFAGIVADQQTRINELLTEGRILVEVVERLVCRLYGLPGTLTDRVVRSAVARAGTLPADIA